MKKRQLYILIVLLVIGFASVTTSLIINGNLKIGFNSDDYDVIFIEALLDGKESTNAIINDDRKTITFTTDKLINIGDSARLDYKVKNISHQYDADVSINCTIEENEYISLTGTFDNKALPLSSNVNIKAQEIKNGYINAELVKGYPGEDTSLEITCKLDFNATSRENYAYSLIFNSNGGSKIEDKSINLNDTYGELEEPIREGYTFLGWFNEDDVKVDNSTVMNTKGDKNLNAKWSTNAYKLELNKVYPDKTESSEINVPYGESIDTLITVGEKNYIDNIECTNGYTISNFDKTNAIYNEETISITNNKTTKDGVCTFRILQGIYDYSYTGVEEEFIVPLDGKYKIELWGAQGANYGNFTGGEGAYTSGILNMQEGKTYYLYIGEGGRNKNVTVSFGTYGFNGGSGGNFACYSYHGGKDAYNFYGGGSTDIRTQNGVWNNFDSLKSRIMVAAGGASSNQNEKGAYAGGLIGYSGSRATGGTQTSSGQNRPGGFGYAGYPIYDAGTCGNSVVSGAGSGYYGGATYAASGANTGMTSSGGGSSYISGHSGCNAIAANSTLTNIIHTGQPNHYSGLVFTDTVMIDGAGYNWTNVRGTQTGMPTHNGTGTMTGNAGNGYAKITYLGK